MSAPLSAVGMSGDERPNGCGMFMLKIFVLGHVYESSDLYWGSKLPIQ